MRISSSRRLSCSRLVDADTSSIYLFSCLLAIIATLLVSAISHIVLSPFSGLLLLGLGLAPILPAMAYVPLYFQLPSAPPIDSQAASDRLAPAIRARYAWKFSSCTCGVTPSCTSDGSTIAQLRLSWPSPSGPRKLRASQIEHMRSSCGAVETE